MKRIWTLGTLLLGLAAFAGQVCTIDPPRPAGATGKGLYVVGSKLLDPTGEEFRIRGLNQAHWNSWGSAKGIPMTGANAVRLAMDMRQSPGTQAGVIDPVVAAGLIPIIGNWVGTCSSDPAKLVAIVDTWVAQAATFVKYSDSGIINIANEWGPPNSVVWRDSYYAAISRMRVAGYNGTLMIDSGYCGQDAQDVIKYGQALLDADPEHNLLFDVHVYGGFHYPATAAWMQDYDKAFAALKATGLPVFLGEFGPGRGIGPSPTMVTPEHVVATAEANGFGWAAWAWDDNNLPNCGGNDAWFSMTTSCGRYTGLDTELTMFGKTVVPLFKLTGAKPAAMH